MSSIEKVIKSGRSSQFQVRALLLLPLLILSSSRSFQKLRDACTGVWLNASVVSVSLAVESILLCGAVLAHLNSFLLGPLRARLGRIFCRSQKSEITSNTDPLVSCRWRERWTNRYSGYGDFGLSDMGRFVSERGSGNAKSQGLSVDFERERSAEPVQHESLSWNYLRVLSDRAGSGFSFSFARHTLPRIAPLPGGQGSIRIRRKCLIWRNLQRRRLS